MALLRWIGLMSVVFIIGCGPKEYDTPLVDSPVSTEDETVIDETACQTDVQFVTNQLWPKILSQCATCHNPQGLASSSGYVLQNLASEAQNNIDISRTYQTSHPDLIINKAMALGVSHGGGRLVSEGSDNHDLLIQFVARLNTPIPQCDANNDPSGINTPTNAPDNNTPLSNLNARDLSTRLTLSSASETYRQASLLLAGALPSETQLTAITDNNLKSSIRDLMTGDNFDAFLMEAANDQLLTMKWASDRTPGLAALNGEDFYPQINSRIQPLEDALDITRDDYHDTLATYGLDENNLPDDEDLPQPVINARAELQTAQQATWNARRYTNLALAEEPLRLISHVVQTERHYGEVLTADYIMVNPYSNDVFAAGATFNDNLDPEEWKPASINSGYRNRSNDLPHAGILTSPMFLARYPSTDTNRNRARARWTYYFF